MGSTNNTASQSVAGAARSAHGNNASIDTTPTPAAPPPPTPTPSTLSGSVGINAQNNSDDVWQVSSGLAANGYLDAPTRDATPEMQSKIITAQQDMGDLKPDGLVNPGGPTETRFQQLAGQGFMKAPSQDTAFGKSPAATPNPSEVKDGTTAKAFARMQQDKQDAARAEASEDRQRQDAQAVNAVKAAKTDQKAATMMAQIQAAASTKAPATTKPESLLPHKDMLREGQDEGLRNGQTAPDIGADAFQSNQRTAEFVKSRNTLGDLPKFTVDAINSDDEDDGVKAMNEVSNLIHQIAETDPDKAQDLLHRTREGLTPERRDMFERILDPGSDQELPITHRPTSDAPIEIDTKVYYPDRDSVAKIAMNDADTTTESPNAESPSRGKVSDDLSDKEIDPFDGATGLHGMELHARDQRRGFLDETDALSAEGKPISEEQTSELRQRAEQLYKHDDVARKEAMSAIDAMADGNLGAASRNLGALKSLSEDRNGLRKNREIAEYYERNDEAARKAYARERGKRRAPMELMVQYGIRNEADVREQEKLLARHSKAADAGDVNAERIAKGAQLKLLELREQRQHLSKEIAAQSAHYLEVPGHPHPTFDKRGAAEERAIEQRERDAEANVKDAQEMLTDAALTLGSRTLPGALARAAGRGLLALGTDTTKGAAAYPEELRASVSRMVEDAGIDKMDADAVNAWLKENPDTMDEAQSRAMQAAFAATIGGTFGKRVGKKMGGEPTSKITAEAGREAAKNAAIKVYFPNVEKE